MSKLDPFTQRRLLRFVENWREKGGVLPTLQDFDKAGFSKELVNQAVREKLLEEFYVTLTNGTVVKGYKCVSRYE